MLHKVDEWVLDKFQDGYLWLLDRTGCYCGTLIFLSWSGCLGTRIYSNDWFDWLLDGTFSIIVVIISGIRYYLQGAGMYNQYNALALIERANFGVRMLANTTVGVFFLGELVAYHWKHAFGCFCLFLYYHTVTICIREREKKPFFEFKPKLAPQAT